MATVGRARFEALLREVQSRTLRPREGLYGPASTTWSISRESCVFLGGGAAALLQLAHPYVAHAVAEHSATRSDPLGRFHRTFRHVYAMTLGDTEAALASAKRVRAIHERVAGTIKDAHGPFAAGHRYRATDEAATRWVHATLIHTAIQCYEACAGPLSSAQKDAYWDESKDFATLFGLSAASLPPNWCGFLEEWRQTLDSGALHVGAHARELSSFLLRAPPGPRGQLIRWYGVITAGLLPPYLRDAYGLPWGPRSECLFRRSLAAIRRIYPRLPRRLRDVPAFVEAQRRLAETPGPDRIGRALETFALWAFAPARDSPYPPRQ